MIMDRYTYSYPSEINSETALLEDMTKLCRKYGYDKHRSNKILIVLSELFNNAVIHGNKCRAELVVDVVIKVKTTGFYADIIDNGVDGLAAISNRVTSDEFAEGGRGVDIVEHYCDQFEYHETANGGMRVSIGFEFEKEIINK